MNNKNFKRVEFDAFKNAACSNSFMLTPEKWKQKNSAGNIHDIVIIHC